MASQDMENFISVLNSLKDFAALQGGFVTKEQIAEAFPELDSNQSKLIYEYLEKNHIGIDEPINQDTLLSEDDHSYLQMYLEEIDALECPDEDLKRVWMLEALDGKQEAKKKLIPAYLKNVIDIAKLYAGQGALMEDLIGEGNVALTLALDMITCVETVEDAEALIVRTIMNSMEEYIGVESAAAEAEKKALELVMKVAGKAKELANELLRKVTVEELAAESKFSKKQIKEAMMISELCLEYIEQPEETKDE